MNLIEYVLKRTDLNQKQIAAALGVSSTQISKWKSGDEIPAGRQMALTNLVDASYDEIEWELLGYNSVQREQWFDYLRRHVEWVDSRYVSDIVEDEGQLPSILGMFARASIKLPESPPVEAPDGADRLFEPAAFDQLFSLFLNEYFPLMNYTDHCFHYSGLTNQIDGIQDEVYAIDCALKGFALLEIPDTVLTDAGAEPEKVVAYATAEKHVISKNLVQICEHMATLGIPIQRDYFDLLNESADWLEEECMVIGPAHYINRIENHLPYADRMLLSGVKHNQKLLLELHHKIDTLLSSESKAQLSTVIKHTCP